MEFIVISKINQKDFFLICLCKLSSLKKTLFLINTINERLFSILPPAEQMNFQLETLYLKICNAETVLFTLTTPVMVAVFD